MNPPCYNQNDAQASMLKQQLRAAGLLDAALLTLIQETARDQFVPKAYQTLAFADMHIPLGHGQCMFSPYEEAKALAVLSIQPHENVLEIGTGSGYFTALLAKQARVVHTVDVFPDLVEEAEKKLHDQGLYGIHYHSEDANENAWSDRGPYDAIVVTAVFSKELPDTYRHALKPGGRILALVKEGGLSSRMFLSKHRASQDWVETWCLNTDLPCLIQTNQEPCSR